MMTSYEPMAATQVLKKIDIFISSPSDVSAERDIIKHAIEFLNRLIFVAKGYLLFPLAYEELVPPEVGAVAQAIIDRYMLEPDQCDLLICVLWLRMGTPFTHPKSCRTYQSGTEYEFLKAYETNQKLGRPQILLYRRVTTDIDQHKQEATVSAFFRKFAEPELNFKGLYGCYSAPSEFERLVTTHIVDVFRSLPLETEKTVERPQMIEEERRLDTAVPQAARIGKATELWVQLCLPDSLGFRRALPENRISELELSQEDVTEHPLAVTFPLNSTTTLPEPVVLAVEVIAPDFEIPISRQSLRLVHGEDSPRLLFSLVPKVIADQSAVHVHVRQTMPEGAEVVVATASLHLRTTSADVRHPIWLLIRRPLETIQSLTFSEGSPEASLIASLPEEIDVLISTLARWGSWEEKVPVARRLTEIGERAIPGYLRALRRTAPNRTWGVIRALTELGPPTVPILLEALEEPNPVMRINAVHALDRLDGLGKPSAFMSAARALLRTLQDDKPDVKVSAADALADIWPSRAAKAFIDSPGKLDTEAFACIEDTSHELVSCLFHESTQVQDSASRALWALEQICPGAATRAIRSAGSAAIDVLVGIEEAHRVIYADTGWLLAAIGEPAVPSLIGALQRHDSSHKYVCHRLKGVLENIGTPEAVTAVRTHRCATQLR